MAKLKVLMFGWEFPPFNSGGLGVACQGLARALARQGEQIIFVLPKKLNYQKSGLQMVFADSGFGAIYSQSINSLLIPYITSAAYSANLSSLASEKSIYGLDLFGEVTRYAQKAGEIAKRYNFDIVHSHDWLSIPAGLSASKASGRPLVVHIHATEFDRSGSDNINQRVYEIERTGMLEAQAVITVSNFTKNIIISRYGISPEKIKVVYNAVEDSDFNYLEKLDNLVALKNKGVKIVLFVGRITLQKGPDYFLKMAQKILEYKPNVRFLIVGSGDMERQMIDEAAWLGIADKVFFMGFLDRSNDLSGLYQLADLYVLPSVSEPFGITPLEALLHGTPVLISKQSGVAETISHCLKVDFWDIDEMANKALAVLNYPVLRQTLAEHGSQEVKRLTWDNSAKKCLEIYSEVLAHHC